MTDNCPRDDTKLDSGHLFGVESQRCPACQGVFVKQTLLNKLLKEMAGELIKEISLDEPLEYIQDKGAGIFCPTCQKAMENYGYMGSHKVMIDRCPQCNGLWLDTLELGVMSLQHARSHRRLEHAYQKRQEFNKELDRHFDEIILAMAIERLVLYGFIVGSIASGVIGGISSND